MLSLSFALLLAATVSDARSPAGGVYAELPFLTGDTGYRLNATHIVIDIAPQGSKPLPLVLDTGAAFSVLTPGAARHLGISVRRTKNSPYRRKTSLSRDLQFWIDTTLSDTGSQSGWELGLLGGNFLEKYDVEIDYAKRVVRFLDPRAHPVPKEPTRPGEIVAPLRLRGSRPYVELGIGEGTARFMVDTGAYFDLEISEREARRLGLDPSHAEIVRGQNWIGQDRSARTELASVRIGRVDIGPATLLTTLHEGSGWRHTNQAGSDEAVLGSEFLSRFHVRIDYKHRRMSLVPLSDEERAVVAKLHAQLAPVSSGAGGPKSFQLERAGLTLAEVKPGAFQVVQIRKGGLAADLGLHQGDVIVNALGEKALRPSEIEERMVERRELTVARKDGNTWVDRILPKPVYDDESGR